ENEATISGMRDALDQFDRGWLAALEHAPAVDLWGALVGLTRLGEQPTRLDRLAAVLDRTVSDTEDLLRQNFTVHIQNGDVDWAEEFPGDQTRRTLSIGDRQIPMKQGCAPDLIAIAALLDVPFSAEEPCAATGTPIRITFTPNGIEQVEPPSAVAAVLPPEQAGAHASGTISQIDAGVCVFQPFFASADAAEEWLAAHPGGRVFTIEEMFQRPIFTYYRDHLRPRIHPEPGSRKGPESK
ncbi:MAG TPA: organomercurial lyase, partial [Asanoa sp.]|nr:organomercurial lyase [Asanoa sp.]